MLKESELHSQYGEDEFILKIVGDTLGAVLDIGAWDATTFSNSRALIERGWKALLFEPSPGPLRGLVKEYGNNDRVRVVGAAVTLTGGLIDLQVTDDAVTVPAGDVARIEQWKASGGFYGKLTVPSLSMVDLFQQFGGDFQVASIDSEGTSVELFAEMIRIGPRPQVIVLEHDGRYVEVAQIAERSRYQQVHLNGTNVVLKWGGTR